MVGPLGGVVAVALFLWAPGAGATEVRSVFPSDRLTITDPAQLSGRRMALPLPLCAADPSGCDIERSDARFDIETADALRR